MTKLTDKIALVTGASSGIGAAAALRLVEAGATVVGYDLKRADDGDWIAATRRQPQCHFIQGDVCDESALQAAVTDTVARFGALDILVNSAGIGSAGPVHLLDTAEFDRVLAINLRGTFLACKAALPAMMEKRAGAIVNIASVDGLEAGEITGAYNASKGGVILLTRNMAIDYGRLGIRVNAICPGFIETPLSAAIQDSGIRGRIDDAHQLGRMGQPREVANVIAFVASDEASFITGSALTVDGGISAGKRFGIAETWDMGLSP